MLSSRSWWTSRHFPLLAPDGEGGGGGGATGSEGGSGAAGGGSGAAGGTGGTGGTGSTGTDDGIDESSLNENGKAALKRLRDQREAARAATKAAEDERDALRKEKSDRDAADAKAKDDAAAASGKWEELATKRETDLTAAKADVTRLGGENAQLKTAITAVLDAEWKELPAEVRDAYLGAEDDPLAKLAFLPKGKALAAKLADKADPKRGNGRDPKAGGDGTPELKSLIPKSAFLG